MAAGRWVLKKAYVEDSSEGGQFRNPKSYVHDECVITHRKNWKRFEKNKKQLMGGIFYNMKALFVMDDIEAKERGPGEEDRLIEGGRKEAGGGG